MLADLISIAVKFLLQFIEFFLQLDCAATAIPGHQVGKTSATHDTQGKSDQTHYPDPARTDTTCHDLYSTLPAASIAGIGLW